MRNVLRYSDIPPTITVRWQGSCLGVAVVCATTAWMDSRSSDRLRFMRSIFCFFMPWYRKRHRLPNEFKNMETHRNTKKTVDSSAVKEIVSSPCRSDDELMDNIFTIGNIFCFMGNSIFVSLELLTDSGDRKETESCLVVAYFCSKFSHVLLKIAE